MFNLLALTVLWVLHNWESFWCFVTANKLGVPIKPVSTRQLSVTSQERLPASRAELVSRWLSSQGSSFIPGASWFDHSVLICRLVICLNCLLLTTAARHSHLPFVEVLAEFNGCPLATVFKESTIKSCIMVAFMMCQLFRKIYSWCVWMSPVPKSTLCTLFAGSLTVGSSSNSLRK